MKALVIYDLTGHIWNIIYSADSYALEPVTSQPQ